MEKINILKKYYLKKNEILDNYDFVINFLLYNLNDIKFFCNIRNNNVSYEDWKATRVWTDDENYFMKEFCDWLLPDMFFSELSGEDYLIGIALRFPYNLEVNSELIFNAIKNTIISPKIYELNKNFIETHKNFIRSSFYT